MAAQRDAMRRARLRTGIPVDTPDAVPAAVAIAQGRRSQPHNAALAQALEQIPIAEGATGELEFEGELWRVRRCCKLSEDEYVALQFATLTPMHDLKSTRDKMEQYARWRYRGYLVGAVAIL